MSAVHLNRYNAESIEEYARILEEKADALCAKREERWAMWLALLGFFLVGPLSIILLEDWLKFTGIIKIAVYACGIFSVSILMGFIGKDIGNMRARKEVAAMRSQAQVLLCMIAIEKNQERIIDQMETLAKATSSYMSASQRISATLGLILCRKSGKSRQTRK